MPGVEQQIVMLMEFMESTRRENASAHESIRNEITETRKENIKEHHVMNEKIGNLTNWKSSVLGYAAGASAVVYLLIFIINHIWSSMWPK